MRSADEHEYGPDRPFDQRHPPSDCGFALRGFGADIAIRSRPRRMLGLESSIGQRSPQGWEFYAAGACLFITLASPGFVWRYLRRRVHDEVAGGEAP